jgi:hypothetical protein
MYEQKYKFLYIGCWVKIIISLGFIYYYVYFESQGIINIWYMLISVLKIYIEKYNMYVQKIFSINY